MKKHADLRLGRAFEALANEDVVVVFFAVPEMAGSVGDSAVPRDGSPRAISGKTLKKTLTRQQPSNQSVARGSSCVWPRISPVQADTAR